jgi:hypothetical protein
MSRLCTLLIALAVVDGSPAEEPKPPAGVAVPYRLTPTQHVLVRAKLNGKGPFNFILDTGAPALFVTKAVAEKTGAAAEPRGWSRFDRLEIEGGVVVEPARGRAEDLFQLEGMNGMGLAGVELHGVIGYNILAQYRIEFDFTRDKLRWTRLDFEPPPLARMGGRGTSAGLEALGTMMKFLGGLMGLKANFAVEPRGFIGAELAEDDGRLVVRRVLADGPAAQAGLKAGDVILAFDRGAVATAEAFGKRLARLAPGTSLPITIERAGRELPLSITLGRGL